MKVLANLVLPVFLAVVASAQSTSDAARVQNLVVVQEKDGVRVEVDLTSPVTPRVKVATGPDRLLLELPGVGPGAQRAPIPVSQNGVKWVWVESDPLTSPTVARVS